MRRYYALYKPLKLLTLQHAAGDLHSEVEHLTNGYNHLELILTMEEQVYSWNLTLQVRRYKINVSLIFMFNLYILYTDELLLTTMTLPAGTPISEPSPSGVQ